MEKREFGLKMEKVKEEGQKREEIRKEIGGLIEQYRKISLDIANLEQSKEKYSGSDYKPGLDQNEIAVLRISQDKIREEMLEKSAAVGLPGPTLVKGIDDEIEQKRANKKTA